MRDCESARLHCFAQSFGGVVFVNLRIFAWYEVVKVCVDVVRGRRL